MTVFVTAAAVADVGKIDKATETRLLDAIKAARQTRKDLEKGLKAQHGKKREAWPAEIEDQMVRRRGSRGPRRRRLGLPEGEAGRTERHGRGHPEVDRRRRHGRHEGSHRARQLGLRRPGDRRGEWPPIRGAAACSLA